nr:serine/threonine protein kinase [Deltaproteobacteria bacterium]
SMVNPAARPRFLAPGDKLGKYDLIRQIAVGGMAELYLARTVGIEGFEKLVVVKRILPQFASNASFVNMFLNEARLAATLHHPNIAQVYDIGVEGTEYFFAMEYIHGEDLGRMVASATDSGVPISLDVSLTLVAGLCAGLHYAHEKVGNDGKPLNVVHRDVSPSNVLVSYDGAVKLVDFGIARAGSQPSTTRGGIKGKIGYMSPEQCRGKEMLDRRSDLFSVGALLFELTCGRLPFVDETEYGVLNQIVNSDAPPPSQLVPSYPPALEKIVLKALARDREQRYSTGIQLQGDIEDFAHENRLRISPLVLARLMGSLFPERLEEWDSARAQGAFFVEQHVVRTLIESGKTSESGVAYEAASSANKTAVDEDTSVEPPPPSSAMSGDNEPTNIQTSIADLERPRTRTPMAPARHKTPPPVDQPTAPLPVSALPLPAPPSAPIPVTPRVQMTPPIAPTPHMPGAVPIVNPLAAKGGSLVSSAGAYGAPAAPIPAPTTAMLSIGDTTERVRVPTPVYNTSYPSNPNLAVQPRSRLPIILLAAAGAIGVVIATVIVLSGGDAPETKAAAVPANVEMKTEPVPEPAVVKEEPKPEEPTIVEVKKPEPAPEPVPEPVVVKEEPKPKKPIKTAAKAEPKKPPKPEAKKPVAKKEPVVAKKEPEPKPEPTPEPKEAGKWNADSPFMPVRPPDKKP